jgi:hypothetical protein
MSAGSGTAVQQQQQQQQQQQKQSVVSSPVVNQTVVSSPVVNADEPRPAVSVSTPPAMQTAMRDMFDDDDGCGDVPAVDAGMLGPSDVESLFGPKITSFDSIFGANGNGNDNGNGNAAAAVVYQVYGSQQPARRTPSNHNIWSDDAEESVHVFEAGQFAGIHSIQPSPPPF